MTDVALAADFALIIVAATVIGLVARQLGQPTIVAYIVTGVVLGTVVLDVVIIEGLVEHMAELGLGFLLFLLGLKMRFDDIREILRPITNIAIGQTILQTALAFVVAWALGFDTTAVIVIALATVFGATPILLFERRTRARRWSYLRQVRSTSLSRGFSRRISSSRTSNGRSETNERRRNSKKNTKST